MNNRRLPITPNEIRAYGEKVLSKHLGHGTVDVYDEQGILLAQYPYDKTAAGHIVVPNHADVRLGHILRFDNDSDRWHIRAVREGGLLYRIIELGSMVGWKPR